MRESLALYGSSWREDEENRRKIVVTVSERMHKNFRYWNSTARGCSGGCKVVNPRVKGAKGAQEEDNKC